MNDIEEEELITCDFCADDFDEDDICPECGYCSSCHEKTDCDGREPGLAEKRAKLTGPSKPRVQLSGQDGNVFNLMGLCSKALRRHGNTPEEKKLNGERAKEMLKEITSNSKSYDEALMTMMKYCEVS